jgi:hypothetical protein
MHPDPNLTGLHEIGDPRVGHLLRLRETCQHGGERDREKQPCHVRLQGFCVHRKRTRPAQCAYVSEFDTLKPIDATALGA